MQPKYWVQHFQLLFHMFCFEIQVSMLSADEGLPYPDNELPNKNWTQSHLSSRILALI